MLSKNFALAAILVGLSAPVFAAGDAMDGQDEFGTKCAICHTVEPGGPGGAGPNLYGVVGTKAGSRPGFPYSDAMKGSVITWTNDNLVKYLQSPGTLVPGTQMALGFQGTTPDMAADIAAYLATLNGTAPLTAPADTGATTPSAGGIAPAPAGQPATPAPAQ